MLNYFLLNGTCLIIFVLFSVALKFGVGVALVFVAHFVLIRKWSDDGLYEFFYVCLFYLL